MPIIPASCLYAMHNVVWFFPTLLIVNWDAVYTNIFNLVKFVSVCMCVYEAGIIMTWLVNCCECVAEKEIRRINYCIITLELRRFKKLLRPTTRVRCYSCYFFNFTSPLQVFMIFFLHFFVGCFVHTLWSAIFVKKEVLCFCFFFSSVGCVCCFSLFHSLQCFNNWISYTWLCVVTKII